MLVRFERVKDLKNIRSFQNPSTIKEIIIFLIYNEMNSIRCLNASLHAPAYEHLRILTGYIHLRDFEGTENVSIFPGRLYLVLYIALSRLTYLSMYFYIFYMFLIIKIIYITQSLDLDENMIIENQMTAYAFYICLAGIPLLIVWAVNGLTIWEIVGKYPKYT